MALITQKIKFVLFVLSVGKRKNPCNLCNLLTKKPCYPHGLQGLTKVKFATYH